MSSIIIGLLWVGVILLILGSIVYLVFQIVKKTPVIKIIWRTVINMVCIFMAVAAVNIVSGISSEVIFCVKDRSPGMDGITYGQALDNYLENAEWEFFSSSTDPSYIVVEVNGECTYQNERAKATIQFSFDPSIPSSDEITKDTEFKLSYVGKNDEGLSSQMANELLNAAFQSYAVKENISYDDQPFFDEEGNSGEDINVYEEENSGEGTEYYEGESYDGEEEYYEEENWSE